MIELLKKITGIDRIPHINNKIINAKIFFSSRSNFILIKVKIYFHQDESIFLCFYLSASVLNRDINHVAFVLSLLKLYIFLIMTSNIIIEYCKILTKHFK